MSAKKQRLHDAAAVGDVAAVCTLLDGGAAIDAVDASSGATPLHTAARGGHEAVVRLLLERGASVDVRDRDGKTASQVASSVGVRHLLDENSAARA